MSATKVFQPKTFLALLRRPTSIAAIASVGFHAVLFVASPRFSQLSLASLADPETLNNERRVPLVELTPQEQSRLPDFNRRSFSFDDGFQFPPGGLDSNGTVGSGQSGLDRTIISGNSGFGSRGNSTTYYGGSGSSAGRRNQQNQGSRGSGTAEGTTGNSNSSTGSSDANLGDLEIRPEELARLNDPQDLEYGGNTDDAGNSADPRSADSSSESGGEGGEDTASGTGSERSLSDAPPASTSAEDLIAELEANRENYTYNASGVSESEAAAKLEGWLTTARGIADNPTLQPINPIELPMAYPRDLCLTPPPEAAKVGVLLSPGGELAEEPTLLKSTGYLGLNRLAIAQVVTQTQAEDFPEISDFCALIYNVPIDYDAEDSVDPNAF